MNANELSKIFKSAVGPVFYVCIGFVQRIEGINFVDMTMTNSSSVSRFSCSVANWGQKWRKVIS